MPGRRVVIDHLNQPIPRVVAVLANGSINRQRYLCETTQAVITQRPTGSIQNQMPIGVIAQCNRRWIVRMRVLNLDQLRRITLAHGVGRSVLTALKVCLQQHNVVPGIKFEALGHNFFTERVTGTLGAITPVMDKSSPTVIVEMLIAQDDPVIQQAALSNFTGTGVTGFQGEFFDAIGVHHALHFPSQLVMIQGRYELLVRCITGFDDVHLPLGVVLAFSL